MSSEWRRAWRWMMVVLIAAAVGGAVYIWQHHQVTVAQDQLKNQPRNSDSGSNSDASSSTSQLSANYYPIPEWGIRLKITSDLQDLVYFITTNKDGSQVAHFSTRSLMAADAATIKADSGDSIIRHTCHPYGDPLASLARTTKQQPNTDVKPLGDYYYYYAKAETACSNDPNVLKLENQQADSIAQAVKVVELIK